jgi:hypothetical protein
MGDLSCVELCSGVSGPSLWNTYLQAAKELDNRDPKKLWLARHPERK